MKDLKISNKIKRAAVFYKLKSEAARAKLARRKEIKRSEANDPELKKQRLEKNVPKTLENKREADDNLVADDEEVCIV
jgi:ribosome production factor 1